MTYAAAELVVGYGPQQMLVLGVAAALLTLLGVYRAASVLGGRRAGLLAAVAWALCSHHERLQANHPNTEVFLNACLVWGFAALLDLDRRPRTYRRTWVGGAWFSGACFALATVYKPVVICVPAALGIAYLAWPGPAPRNRGSRLRTVAILAVVGAVVWTGVIAYFTARSHLHDFYEAVIVYNRQYSGNPFKNLITSLTPRTAFPPEIQALAPLFALTAVSILWGMRVERRPDDPLLSYPVWRDRGLLFAYVVATQASIAVTGQFFPHYYQLWLPPLAIGTGWAINLIWGSGPGPAARLARLACLVAMAGLLAVSLRPLRWTPEQWSQVKFGDRFIESDRVGRTINGIIGSGESFFVVGDEPGLYFTSRRRPVANPAWWTHLIESPSASKLRAQVLSQLKAGPPDLIIVVGNQLDRLSGGDPLKQWLLAEYRPATGPHESPVFRFYVKNGSALEHRLLAAAQPVR